MNYIQPFTFVFLRSTITALVLLDLLEAEAGTKQRNCAEGGGCSTL